MKHPKFKMLITHLQQTEIFSTQNPEIWRIQMFTSYWIHFTLLNKWFIADTSELWTLITMKVMITVQLNLQTRSLITHIIVTWTLSTMCSLICLQIKHVSECFIAQITDIWTCCTKYNYVSEVCWCASKYYLWLTDLLQNIWHIETRHYVYAYVSL